MAVYRQIQTTFWQDDFVLQLTPEEKYFYLYLLTNSKTKQCGIYQLPRPIIIVETGYNQETVEKLLNRFIDYGKIIYSPATKEIGIVNWPKYNPMESPKIKACVQKELKDVKDKTLIDKIYSDTRYPIQGVSQKEEEKEKEKAEEEAEEKEESIPPLPSAPSPAVEYSSPLGNNYQSGLTLLSSPTPHLSFPRRRESIPKTDSSEQSPDYDDNPDYTGAAITMQSELLLSRTWNKHHPTPEEIRLTTGYLKTFGYTEVETAFSEAVKYDKKRLAYVETVLKKRKERKDLIDKKEKERQKRLTADKELEEQRKSGIGLGLIKTVFGDK